jgi:hypothetical protein
VTWNPGPIAHLDPPADALAFDGVIHVVGINPVVDLPTDRDPYHGAGAVPVLADLAGTTVTATWMPFAGGRRLYLNGAMRAAAGLVPGDRVAVRIWRDPTPRGVTAPDDVRAAFQAAGVWEVYEAWPPSHRRELIVTIEAAKAPATRARRIEKAIAHLRR